jgi:hypothetical protein
MLVVGLPAVVGNLEERGGEPSFDGEIEVVGAHAIGGSWQRPDESERLEHRVVLAVRPIARRNLLSSRLGPGHAGATLIATRQRSGLEPVEVEAECVAERLVAAGIDRPLRGSEGEGRPRRIISGGRPLGLGATRSWARIDRGRDAGTARVRPRLDLTGRNQEVAGAGRDRETDDDPRAARDVRADRHRVRIPRAPPMRLKGSEPDSPHDEKRARS